MTYFTGLDTDEEPETKKPKESSHAAMNGRSTRKSKKM